MAKVKKNKGLTLLDIYEIAIVSGSVKELYKLFGNQDPIGLCPLLELAGYDSHQFESVMGPMSSEDWESFLYTNLSVAFWASGLNKSNPKRESAMTPLRQNILLLYAAYLGEL